MADPKNKKKYVPRKERVTLNERVLPEVKDIEIGEEATIEIKVKMVAKSQGSEYGGFDGEEDDSYELREYGKEYCDAKKKEQSLLKGTFVILSADEDGEDSPEQAAAKKIMADKKKGRVI